MKRVAWVGTPTRYKLNADGDREIDWTHENNRDIPMWVGNKAMTIRVVGKREGMSKEYVFGGGAGPESFILDMTDDDADALLALPGTGENFRDVTHADPDFFEKTYRSFDELSAVNASAD